MRVQAAVAKRKCTTLERARVEGGGQASIAMREVHHPRAGTCNGGFGIGCHAGNAPSSSGHEGSGL
eukprot:5549455-Pyramimonas_sp.AAC.1